jgi:hypothetical protein
MNAGGGQVGSGQDRLRVRLGCVTAEVDVGSSRSSSRQPQLARPSRAIVAGTSTMRTSVASSAIAVARPSPIIFTNGDGSATKLRNTTVMTSAAR